ncbi:MAG TPA: glycosyltransferase family 39 protein [Candidatus Woesebacteria bacterium]|nr:glycosyltransferase family 39 protein [Candidatus Woesebacteria bacterium]
MKAFLWLILASSAVIKSIGLNQSLWLDEAITANTVHHYTLANILKQFSVTDFHPPLYYFFLKVWTNIFGYSEIALRLPSVIFSLITVYVVFLIIRKIWPDQSRASRAALWGAALIAFHPLLIYYAQEARMYSLVVMLIALAIYAKIKKSRWEFYLWSFLSLSTFYGSAFILITIDFWNWGLWLGLLLLSPLIWKQYSTSQTLIMEVNNWSVALGRINWKNLALIPIKLITGRIPFQIWQGLIVIFFWAAAFKAGLKHKFWLKLLIIPIIIGILVSFKAPMMQYFRFQYLVIPLIILLILFQKTQIVFLLFFLIFSLAYIANPRQYREDWKSLSANLPDNTAIYMIGSFADPIIYYRPELAIKDIKTNQPEENNFIYIPYGETIHGLDHLQLLSKLGYKRIKETNFREITYEEWQR